MVKKLPFAISSYGPIDKWIEISGPDGLTLKADYDDVNHNEVRDAVKKMVRILNREWETKDDN